MIVDSMRVCDLVTSFSVKERMKEAKESQYSVLSLFFLWLFDERTTAIATAVDREGEKKVAHTYVKREGSL